MSRSSEGTEEEILRLRLRMTRSEELALMPFCHPERSEGSIRDSSPIGLRMTKKRRVQDDRRDLHNGGKSRLK